MAQTVTFFVILALVFVILPVVLRKLTGRDFIELLVGRPLFGKRKGSGSSPSGKRDDSSGQGQDQDSDTKKEKNGSNSDIIRAVSDIVGFARRNQYYPIVPGILKSGKLETKLAAIVVMRSGVVGIDLFGYGGSVSAKKDDTVWKQTMNGRTREILSPVKICEDQKQILKQFLQGAGYSGIEVSVLPVFTAKDVNITGPSASEVIHVDKMIGELGKNKYVQTKDVDVKAVGTALSAYQFKAQDLRRIDKARKAKQKGNR